MDNLLGQNFEETIGDFDAALVDITLRFEEFKDNITADTHLTELQNTFTQTVDMVNSYNGMATQLSTFEETQRDVVENLNKIKQYLTGICPDPTNCPQLDAIDGALAMISSIQIPTDKLQTVDAGQLQELFKIFDQVDEKLNGIVIESYFVEVKEQINEIKGVLADQMTDFRSTIQGDIGSIFQDARGSVDDIRRLRDDYFENFHTATLVLGSFFASVLVIFLLGMFWGSCSEQGGKSASMAASVLFFTNIILIILAILLFILCTGMFTVGALGQKLVCKTMDKPDQSEILQFMSPLMSNELKDVYGNDTVNISIVQIIQEIRINSSMPLYPLLQLNYIYDIGELLKWKTEYEVNDKIDEARGQILGILSEFTDYQADFDDSKTVLTELGPIVDSALSAVTVIMGDVPALSSQLKELNDTINTMKDNLAPAMADELGSIISDLTSMNTTLVMARENFTKVEEFLEPGTFVNKIEDTIEIVENAFGILEDPDRVPKFFDDSVKSILNVVDVYVHFAVASANTTIGLTGPLSNIYNAAYTDICLEVINPFNAGL